MKRRRVLGLVLAMVAVVASCDRRPEGPKQQRVAGGQPRIVAMSPALAATLKDLGVEKHIVGRHAWDLTLAPSVAVVGDGVGDVDYERLAAVSPTLIVGQFGVGGIPARLTDLAKSRGWALRGYDPLSLGDVMTVARGLAADVSACGGVEERLVEVGRELEASLAPRAGAKGAGRVLILADVSPIAALGPGSVHYEMLIRLGGTPAIERGTPYITLEAEDLLKLAPDAIILVSPRGRDVAPGKKDAMTLVAMFGRTGELDVRALRERRIGLIDDPLAHLTATTIRTTAREMGEMLDAWGNASGSGPK